MKTKKKRRRDFNQIIMRGETFQFPHTWPFGICFNGIYFLFFLYARLCIFAFYRLKKTYKKGKQKLMGMDRSSSFSAPSDQVIRVFETLIHHFSCLWLHSFDLFGLPITCDELFLLQLISPLEHKLLKLVRTDSSCNHPFLMWWFWGGEDPMGFSYSHSLSTVPIKRPPLVSTTHRESHK